MQPQDDPEARIRDLERPLADVARTSELGAGPYSSGGAYTPTPPAYGAPYAAAPRKGFRPSWLVLTLIAAVLVVLAAGVAVFSPNMFTRGGPVTSAPGGDPSVAGGGGSVDKAPSVDEAPIAQPSTPGGGSVTTATPGAPLSVSGVGENKTIACNDSFVSVSGVSNTVTITGHCASLTVSGMENLVTVDTADTISASGFDNRVTYHSGSPQIDTGGSNVVEQG